MVKIEADEAREIVEAVLCWTGWGRETIPRREDSLLIERFGPTLGARLLLVVKSLEEDFYSSDARFIAEDLPEMERLSSEQFRDKHPDAPEEIVTAFAWCYSYDFK